MNKQLFCEKLGKKIAAMRKEKKLTQAQLAQLCDLPRQNINRLEKGLVNPSTYFIALLAKQLKVPVEKLIP